MSKELILDLILNASDYEIREFCMNPEKAKKALRLALKEQDRDTRHAIAGLILLHGDSRDPHELAMNCRLGLPEGF